MKRRMAAILVADVVGYSGLMEADEDGTAQRLANCRNFDRRRDCQMRWPSVQGDG